MSREAAREQQQNAMMAMGRVSFFMSRTGRLQLNSPLFPTATYGKVVDKAIAVKEGEAPVHKENTAEFIGLLLDASQFCVCCSLAAKRGEERKQIEEEEEEGGEGGLCLLGRW